MWSRKRVSILALMTVSACGPTLDGSTPEAAEPSEQSVCAGTTVEGIDVSVWQGSINFGAVRAAGKRFVQIRAAYGTAQDTNFVGNWANAKAAGLYRGAYHYFRPSQDGGAQADFFVSKVGRLGDGDLPAALDIEETEGQSAATIVSRMRTWLSRVEAGTGKRPVIYSSPGFWPTLGSPDLSANPIWVANWGVTCPNLPAHYSTWKFWQYSSTGAVSGISGDVDLDSFNGSIADLAAYAGNMGGGTGNLGGGVVGNLAAAPNADGRLEVFVRGTDNQVWTSFQTAPGAGWTGWYTLGGNVASAPVLGINSDGRMEVFARGGDGALWHSWQAAPNGSFGGWASLGGAVEGEPAVASNADGHLEVFVRGTDGAIYHAWQSVGWSSFAVLGKTPAGGLSDPAVVRGGDGRLYVVARDSGGSVRVISQTAPSSGWNDWTSLAGTVTGPPAAAVNQDGRIEVFARGSDSAMWHNWQTSVSGAFSGWYSLGGVDVSDPAVGRDADGRIELFVRGGDSNLYRIAQVAPNGIWGSYAASGITVTSRPAAATNQDGRLEVFSRATDGSAAHGWQGTPGNW